MVVATVFVTFVAVFMAGRSKMNKEIETVIQQKPQRGREEHGLVRRRAQLMREIQRVGQQVQKRRGHQHAGGKAHYQIQLVAPVQREQAAQRGGEECQYRQ